MLWLPRRAVREAQSGDTRADFDEERSHDRTPAFFRRDADLRAVAREHPAGLPPLHEGSRTRRGVEVRRGLARQLVRPRWDGCVHDARARGRHHAEHALRHVRLPAADATPDHDGVPGGDAGSVERRALPLRGRCRRRAWGGLHAERHQSAQSRRADGRVPAGDDGTLDRRRDQPRGPFLHGVGQARHVAAAAAAAGAHGRARWPLAPATACLRPRHQVWAWLAALHHDAERLCPRY